MRPRQPLRGTPAEPFAGLVKRRLLTTPIITSSNQIYPQPSQSRNDHARQHIQEGSGGQEHKSQGEEGGKEKKKKGENGVWGEGVAGLWGVGGGGGVKTNGTNWQ